MKRCPVCGKLVEKMSYSNACSEKCFDKAFWTETLKNNDRIIVNGACYYVGKEEKESPYEFRGFGGSPFYVKMIKDNANHKSGEIFKSTNMWHNGQIPEEYYTGDNAEFIKKSEYDELVGGTN